MISCNQAVSNAIQACIQKYCNNEMNVRSLLLCGSHAVGLNISRSDLDMSILVEDVSKLGVRDGEYIVEVFDGVRVELLVMSWGLFLKNLRALERYAQSLNMKKHPLDKFVHAVPVWGNEAFSKEMELFERGSFGSRFIDYLHSNGVNVFEDILGALETNKYDLAILWSRRLVTMIMDALLAKHDNFYCRPKWQLERVAVELGKASDLYKMYRKIILTSDSESDETKQSWVKQALIFIREIQKMIFDNLELSGSDMHENECMPMNIWEPIQYLTRRNNQYIIIRRDSTIMINDVQAARYLNLSG